MRDHSQVGAKLAPKVAKLVSESVVYSHLKLVHVRHKLAMSIFHTISDEISSEVDVTLGPILAKLHEITPEDHPAYPAIHFMHTASGQLKALAGTGLQISGLLGSISTVMNNELAPVVYTYVKSNPHLLPDIATISQLYSTGRIGAAEAVDAMNQLGIPASWANNILPMSYTWPDLGSALELLRRGDITRDQFAQWMGLNGIQEAAVGELAKLTGTELSPADLALAVLRGNMSQAEGTAQAAKSGTDAAQFSVLIGNTGEPPGLQQLLEGYRRGFIGRAELEKGIKESRYRDEWIPLLEQLRYEPMSVADAVNATVQDQLPADAAKKYADENGLQPGDFDILLNTAGEPLSRTEMEQLYNRGLVTQAQVDQALRESRLKNKYNGLAFQLHARLLPVSDIQAALRVGAMTQGQAVEKAMEYGYSKDDATIAVTAGINSRILQFRDRVVSSVVTLTEDGLMLPSDAQKVIDSLGYTPGQSKFIIESAQFHLESKYLNSAVTAVRSRYISHHITERQAEGALDSIGVPASQRDYMLGIWKIEHDADVAVPSATVIGRAVKKGAITEEQGIARLVDLGYSEGDAAIVIGAEG